MRHPSITPRARSKPSSLSVPVMLKRAPCRLACNASPPGRAAWRRSGVSTGSSNWAQATSCPASAQGVAWRSAHWSVRWYRVPGCGCQAVRHLDRSFGARLELRQRHGACRQRHAVAGQLPGALQLVERNEVVAVAHAQARSVLPERQCLDLHRLEHLFVFQQPRRRRAVGEKQAVADEVAVVGLRRRSRRRRRSMSCRPAPWFECRGRATPIHSRRSAGRAAGWRPSTRAARRGRCPSRGHTRTKRTACRDIPPAVTCPDQLPSVPTSPSPSPNAIASRAARYTSG